MRVKSPGFCFSLDFCFVFLVPPKIWKTADINTIPTHVLPLSHEFGTTKKKKQKNERREKERERERGRKRERAITLNVLGVSARGHPEGR